MNTKMFRWWKDKKKPKKDKMNRHVEDDYGFRKRAIIVQETISGHTVIIKDDLNHPNVLKFGATCRARMPTPVQNFSETSSHIYDEIPELPVQMRFSSQIENEADIVKDARATQKVDLRSAIEVGPYLIVPLVGQSCSNEDVEIFKRSGCQKCSIFAESNSDCQCEANVVGAVHEAETHRNFIWDKTNKNQDAVSNDTRIVLTRCVKTKSSSDTLDPTFDPMCSKLDSKMCSFECFLNAEEESRTDSPGAESNSRTLTGTPVSNSRTPVFLLGKENEENIVSEVIDSTNDNDHLLHLTSCKSTEFGSEDSFELEDTKRCCDYDMSTSSGSDMSTTSDYDLYLSKIESNLKLKHNVRKIVQSLEQTIEEETDNSSSDYQDCAFREDKFEKDSVTYVSSLSEYSSAASHLSDISADRSASDDSSGYYECADDSAKSRENKRDSRVCLERSVSAPDGNGSCSNRDDKKSRKKHQRHKKSQNRSNSFDFSIYKPLSEEQNQELYHLPSNNKCDSDSSSSSSGTRMSKSKPVLLPQPTPAYMDPYRGRSRSHNRLLGDLIRMNYNKQTFIQR